MSNASIGEGSSERLSSPFPYPASPDEPDEVVPDEVVALIPAAGRGRRLGGERKQLRRLGDAPVVVQTLRAFERCAAVGRLVVAGPPSGGGAGALREELEAAGLSKLHAVARGGATRAASVRRALEVVPEQTEIVLVHDAVRPFVRPGRIAAVVEATRACGAAALAVPVSDTLRRADGEDCFSETIDRAGCFQMQTPQGFRRAWLAEGFARAEAGGAHTHATDDVALVQAAGHAVRVVGGDRRNIKITTPADWQLARALWPSWKAKDEGRGASAGNPKPETRNPKPATRNRNAPMRIGHGYDVHRFEDADAPGGRPLVLGGVEIEEAERGLVGHSDADVLLHAIADALLGAAALGDLGAHFPDTGEAWAGADSLDLLRAVHERVAAEGYAVENVDATAVLDAPRLRPHVEVMRRNVAGALEVEGDRVSVKATTSEGLGFAGRKEGAAAHAMCLLTEKR